MIQSYGKTYHWNDLRVKDLFDDYVSVEEKIDGYQLSFGRFDNFEETGTELWMKTKNVLMGEGNIWEPLQPFWERLKTLELRTNWTYRGEFLNSKNMVKIQYGRVPSNNLVLWDVDVGTQEYLGDYSRAEEALRLGFEPLYPVFRGRLRGVPEELKRFVPKQSLLGGGVEGLVIKGYGRLYNKKLLRGKFVL